MISIIPFSTKIPGDTVFSEKDKITRCFTDRKGIKSVGNEFV